MSTINTVTAKIVGYDPNTQHIMVVVKSDLCQKGISEYPPINIDLANTTIPYDIDSALKDAVAASYTMLLTRHRKESNTPEFFEQLANSVNARMQEDRTFVVGVDIPADPRKDLQDETSVPTTLESSVRVV